MRPDFSLKLSIGLNVLLILVIVWAFHLRRTNVRADSVAPESVFHRPTRVEHTASPVVADRVERSAPFHWSELESPDYRIYITRLRSVGCPEATIRDIIAGDVNALFAERVRSAMESITDRFWDFMANPDQFEELVRNKQEELKALERERDELMRMLLKKDPLHTLAMNELEQAEKLADWKWRLDYLSDDKVSLIHQAHLRYETARVALEEKMKNEPEAERQLGFRELIEERDREITAALSPQELAEYRLRTSGRADFREHITLDLTEEETREIIRARLGSNRNEQIAQLLGPERYAEYERFENEDYRVTVRIMDRFDLPLDVAAQVFEMQRKVQSLSAEIGKDESRSTEERAEVLQAIGLESTQALVNLLGPEIFKTYRQYNGGWLSNQISRK